MPRGNRFEAVVRSDVEPLPAVCRARWPRTFPGVKPLGLDLLHVVFNARGRGWYTLFLAAGTSTAQSEGVMLSANKHIRK